MQRKGKGKTRYLVSPGEKVTLVFTPINVGEEFVAVSLDDEPLDTDPDAPAETPTFKFPVADSVHILMYQCSFVDPDPGNPEPRFNCELSADLDGTITGPFPGPTVKKSDELKRIGLRFSTE